MKTFFKFHYFILLVLFLTSHATIAQGYKNPPKNNDKPKGNYSTPPASEDPPVVAIASPLQPVDVPQTGCGAIWNHLARWEGKNKSEVPASKICFSWYDAPAGDDGVSVIVDPIFSGVDGGVVVVIDSVRIDKFYITNDSPDIKFKQGAVEKDRSSDGVLRKVLDNTVFSIDARTNLASIRNSKGSKVTNIQFFGTNQKGEMWGRCKHNNMPYYVKMNWIIGKQVGNKFSKLN